jgi:general secretion pathway protein J
VEVLIALAITALVGVLAYSSLSTVLTGVEGNREAMRRSHEIDRAWQVLTRDLRHFAARAVRDEFGELEPAMSGGQAARFALSFTRSGWHNPQLLQRSTLQRINYLWEDDALWRESYSVLDRAPDTEPRRVKLLDKVAYLEIGFLGSLQQARPGRDRDGLDTRDWSDNWVIDSSQPGNALQPPVALEIRLQLEDWGEMRRLYALPPI